MKTVSLDERPVGLDERCTLGVLRLKSTTQKLKVEGKIKKVRSWEDARLGAGMIECGIGKRNSEIVLGGPSAEVESNESRQFE